MNRKSQLKGMAFVIFLLISCNFLQEITFPGSNNQDEIRVETITPEIDLNSLEDKVRRNFEGWVSVPYRGVQIQLLTVDDTYITMKITAEFQDEIALPWLEKEAIIECKNVGDRWSCNNHFDFRLTTSAQATISALQSEIQVMQTQQAEFDENCVNPIIKPNEEAIIHLLEIYFWPEYDQPGMLVIYQISLSSFVTLPTELALRIPARAGEPNAVATKDDNGTLINVSYSRRVENELAYITFNTSSNFIQLEYYDPDLVAQENSRHYEYQWQNDYPIDNFFVRIQQPTNALNMHVSPEMFGPIFLSGMYYYCTNLGTELIPFDSRILIDYQISESP